jgi:hypothetical protein
MKYNQYSDYQSSSGVYCETKKKYLNTYSFRLNIEVQDAKQKYQFLLSLNFAALRELFMFVKFKFGEHKYLIKFYNIQKEYLLAKSYFERVDTM